MKGHGTKFGRKKDEAITALLNSRNTEEAAKAAGIAQNTLLKWMRDPEFDSDYRQAKRAAFGQCVARLQHGATAAATTLLKLLVDSSTPPSVKVRAAECILSYAMKGIELEDLEARVAGLERTTDDFGGAGGTLDFRRAG